MQKEVVTEKLEEQIKDRIYGKEYKCYKIYPCSLIYFIHNSLDLPTPTPFPPPFLLLRMISTSLFSVSESAYLFLYSLMCCIFQTLHISNITHIFVFLCLTLSSINLHKSKKLRKEAKKQRRKGIIYPFECRVQRMARRDKVFSLISKK